MTCRLCQLDKPLVDAHIIPRAFFESAKLRRSEPLFMVPTESTKRLKKAPIGPYDRHILCADCDGDLNLFDDYAVKLFRSVFVKKHCLREPSGALAGFAVPSFDYKKLKLFFLAVLWRAAVSEHEHFRNVRLGEYESIVRQMLRNEDPGSPEDFPVFLTRFAQVHPILTMLNPVRTQIEGLNYYTFYLIACNAHIKVDDRANFDAATEASLAPGKPLYVLMRDFVGTPEETVVEKAIRRIKEG